MLRRTLKGRRLARALAVEALYRFDVMDRGGEPFQGEEAWKKERIQSYLEEILSRERVAPPLVTFARELVEAYVRSAGSVDELVTRHLKGWKFEELRPLERSILRIATAELLHLDTPVPVVINEALEIVKVLCGEEPRALVNGVLDAIAQERKLT